MLKHIADTVTAYFYSSVDFELHCEMPVVLLLKSRHLYPIHIERMEVLLTAICISCANALHSIWECNAAMLLFKWLSKTRIFLDVLGYTTKSVSRNMGNGIGLVTTGELTNTPSVTVQYQYWKSPAFL